METRIISFMNHKGGVGKTTTVASLGASLAYKGYSVLLVDLDAQSNLTSSLLEAEQDTTVYDTLILGKPLPIQFVKDNLDLVPASSEMIGLDLELSNKLGREYLLKKALDDNKRGYDFILIDCPPSLGLTVLGALTASTEVIIPMTAEALPTKGVQKIEETIEVVRESLNSKLSISGILITRYEKGKLANMVETYLKEKYGSLVLDTKIRKNVSIAEAPLSFESIIDYAPNSNGAKDYLELAREIISRGLNK